jgi:hypothetical protein
MNFVLFIINNIKLCCSEPEFDKAMFNGFKNVVDVVIVV